MELEYILILAGAMAATFIAAGIYFTARTRRKVTYMLDAMRLKTRKPISDSARTGAWRGSSTGP